jgi:hypothetical protein
MRKIFTVLLLLAGFVVSAQQYNNEWIQYNQTYYKIKVGKPANGQPGSVYRIPRTLLDAYGIGGTQVQNFELWRNGQKVPFYPSVSSGPLPSDGYLEFWAEPNDGKADKPLYRDPSYQHTDKISLQTDTAVYFLSVNTNQSGFRVVDVNNNVAGNSLPAEPYFMYTAGFYADYNSNNNGTHYPNPGYAAIVGAYLYSASYDKGEFFGTSDIYPASPLSLLLSNTLNVYPSGPQGTLKFGAVGTALNARNIRVQLNGTLEKDTVMNFFDDLVTSVPVDNSLISSGSATLQFTNTSTEPTDRMEVSFIELTYPRKFDFEGRKNFKFVLPARSGGYFLQIANFAYGSVAPVLYDMANGERYTGDISTPGTVKFALPGTANDRQLVLVNEEAANITTVTQLTTRNFVNYTNAANQGDYIIITNSLLYVGSSGNNPVIDYKNYRQSTAGGSFNVLIVDIDDLVDQFAFGIKKHPLSVRNFIRFARSRFATTPKYVFLIGRGMNYADYQRADRFSSVLPMGDMLNLVPTFGNPGSDNLLSADDLTVPVATTPIGRLSVVSGKEIEIYLQKIKEYELAQKNSPNTLAGREWMKNVVHITGSSDAYLGTVLCNYMSDYKLLIEDTMYGGKVTTFCKTSTNPLEAVSPEKLTAMFAEGISFLTYFGHSSATALEFNVDDPSNYYNPGKYPVFFVNGCDAGNFFNYYAQRYVANETLSEKFVLANERGTIGFVASTHFGLVNYLNLYLLGLYNLIGHQDFDKSLGITVRDALQQLVNSAGSYDFYARIHAEEMTLHGDPAIYINAEPKPDYVIEQSLIKITPPFISVAEKSYSLKVKAVNLGKAVSDSITLEIKQQYPNGSTGILYRKKIPGIRAADSVSLDVAIVSTRDKGQNRIIATIDADNNVDEIAENNNTASQDFFIYEDEARPVFPYDYAITNNPTQKLYASTANPLSPSKTYVMDIDTSGAFNSSLKVRKTITTIGGVIEFDHGLHFLDSTVYYWRIAPVSGAESDYRWNIASFMYINGTVDGFNMSQYYQHNNSTLERISLDSVTHQWKYGVRYNNVFMRNGVYPTAINQYNDNIVSINGTTDIYNACNYSGLIFHVLDSVTLQPWYNNDAGQPGRFGSDPVCYGDRAWNFQFNFSPTDSVTRHRVVNFLDIIPPGDFVVVKNMWYKTDSYNAYPKDWLNDTINLGSNNSIYHRLLQQGFTAIDSMNRNRGFVFIYQKDRQNFFTPRFALSQGISDKTSLLVDIYTPDTIGYITSPVFGPAKQWKQVLWDGTPMETPMVDNPTVDVIGIDNNNNSTTLYTLDRNTHSFDVSSVDVTKYPFMQLRMRNIDSVHLTPYQLKYWRIFYDPVPEGSLAGNLYLVSKDTVELGEPSTFGIAFKNVSKLNFPDSMLVRVSIIDKSNNTHILSTVKYKPIVVGDTIMIQFTMDTKNYAGNNVVQVEVNPDNNQPEYYHFNNVLYHNLYVRPDNTHPLLDVTFDGVHILNNDIVSAKPHIEIKLKDEAKYLLLNDTSLSTVQVRYPDGSTVRTYHYDGDTLRFIPATSASDNTATIEFTPQFMNQINPDGDEYELIVKGKDRSGNNTGDIAYRVKFRIITKAMISNMLNYPNPFSTSTAFVFTLTGSDLPQNIRIQILTVTGKIVREIPMNELGPLHIGRNITEFKWDGTDQYGDKLANGVYLYRVVTSMNGKRLDKFKDSGDNTDKYFNNGYGKMYLMR